MADSGSAFRDFEQQGWQRASAHYDPGFGPVTRQAVEPLLDALTLRHGERILDVACGPGYVSAAAAARGAVPTGVDFAAAMVGLARARNPQLRFEAGDAEDLHFPNASFDAVAMNFGMLHLAQPERAMAEAFRVLRPGGRYGFTVWEVPEQALGFQIVLESVQLHGVADVGLPAGPPFFRFSDAAECARTLAAAGFRDIRSVTVPLVWRIASGEVLFNTMRDAAVRTAALLHLQTEQARGVIRSAIVARAERFRTGDWIELPMPAVLTLGSRP